MSTPLVALILGYGPNIGASVARKLSANGYKVAVASRTSSSSTSSSPESKDYLALTADFASPSSIPALFTTIQSHFATDPSLVIYNAAVLTPPPDPSSPFSLSADTVVTDMNINTISPFVAAQEAVKRWENLPANTKKTFIYTGNILNTIVIPSPTMMTLGMGKAGSAYWIGTADTSYAPKGYRFHYADERYADGKLKGTAIDGDAHADFYATLAEHAGDVPWHATFVQGQGYVGFK